MYVLATAKKVNNETIAACFPLTNAILWKRWATVLFCSPVLSKPRSYLCQDMNLFVSRMICLNIHLCIFVLFCCFICWTNNDIKNDAVILLMQLRIEAAKQTILYITFMFFPLHTIGSLFMNRSLRSFYVDSITTKFSKISLALIGDSMLVNQGRLKD